MLRFGQGGTVGGVITVTLNGQSLNVPAITRSSEGGASYLEIPVGIGLLSFGSNALGVNFTDAGDAPRVAFAALRVQYDPVCGDWGYATMDFNHDCYVDFLDFATFAQDWLVCSEPNDANCTAY